MAARGTHSPWLPPRHCRFSTLLISGMARACTVKANVRVAMRMAPCLLLEVGSTLLKSAYNVVGKHVGEVICFMGESAVSRSQ